MRKDLLFKIGMFIVLAVGVLAFMPGLLPFRTNKEFVAEWCVIAAFALFLKNRWVGAFTLWSLLSVMLSTYVPVVGLNKAYILTLHIVVIYACFYHLLFENMSIERVGTILDIIAVVGLLQVLMMLIQYNGTWVGILPIHYKDASAVATFKLHPLIYAYVLKNPLAYDCPGFMDMCNTASGLLALCVPAFLRKQWYWGLPFMLGGLWISRSLGGMIPAIIVVLIFFIVKMKKKAIFIIVGAILLFALFIFKYESLKGLLSLTGRVDVWATGYLIVERKPIVGWGLRQTPYLARITYSIIGQGWTNYHNEFLNTLIELGSVGLIIVIGYFITLYDRAKKLLRDETIFLLFLAVLAGFLNCLVNFTMHTVIALPFIVYMASLDKLTRSDYGSGDRFNHC